MWCFTNWAIAWEASMRFKTQGDFTEFLNASSAGNRQAFPIFALIGESRVKARAKTGRPRLGGKDHQDIADKIHKGALPSRPHAVIK